MALGLQCLPRDSFPGHQNPQESSVLPAPGSLRVCVIFQHFPDLVLTLIHSPSFPCVQFPGSSPALPCLVVPFPLLHTDCCPWVWLLHLPPWRLTSFGAFVSPWKFAFCPWGWRIRVGSAGMRRGVTARPEVTSGGFPCVASRWC